MAAKCLYQLFDVRAGCIAGPVIPEVRDAAAVRSFESVLASSESLPGQYPADFQLLCVGEQDDSTATIMAYSEPRIVATGAQWLAARDSLGVPSSSRSSDASATL